jgi:hypothetical protein
MALLDSTGGDLMLVSAILDALFWLANAILSMFPRADVAWLSQVTDKIGDLMAAANRVNAAFPLSDLLAVGLLYGAMVLAVQLVTLVRKIWSLFSGGGGV